MRRRTLIVAPGVAAPLWIIGRGGVPRHQVVALAILKCGMLGFFLWEAWSYRSREIGCRGPGREEYRLRRT